MIDPLNLCGEICTPVDGLIEDKINEIISEINNMASLKTAANTESMPCSLCVNGWSCRLGWPCKCVDTACLITRTAYVS